MTRFRAIFTWHKTNWPYIILVSLPDRAERQDMPTYRHPLTAFVTPDDTNYVYNSMQSPYLGTNALTNPWLLNIKNIDIH